MHQPLTTTPRPELIGPGRFILVVGPSGVGKDTLIAASKAACSRDPTIIFPRRIVTRPASSAEDHDSLTDADFDCAVNNEVFAFWWQAHGLKYAIPRSADDNARAGRTVICNVSRGIVAELRARYARVDAVLVTAPPEILTSRLAGRLRDTDGPLAERMKRNEAYAELRADYVIENIGAPDAAARQLINLINESH